MTPEELMEITSQRIVVAERLARVEQRVDGIDALLQPMAEDVRGINAKLRGRNGFAAGIAFAVSIVWAAVTAGIALMQNGGQ